ncbi:MAG: hypothetical protein AB7N24_01595 [Dehalococcoidia bacterium]
MPGNSFDLRFDVTGPSEDGTFTALCREFPMIIAARSDEELRRKIVNAVDELSAHPDFLDQAITYVLD